MDVDYVCSKIVCSEHISHLVVPVVAVGQVAATRCCSSELWFAAPQAGLKVQPLSFYQRSSMLPAFHAHSTLRCAAEIRKRVGSLALILAFLSVRQLPKFASLVQPAIILQSLPQVLALFVLSIPVLLRFEC